MPQFKLNRDFTFRSPKGVISFVKDKPTNVPHHMVMDVVGIGAEAVEDETPSLVPVDPKVASAPEGKERDAQLRAAIELIVERNNSDDFTGGGTPTVKSMEAVLGFDVDRDEVVAAWKAYNASKA
jgi:hypothetical protein